MRPLLSALLALTLPSLALAGGTAPALLPAGSAAVPGHAAGTFGRPGDLGGPSGGLAWGPDGTAYTLDGARVLYGWDPGTGRSRSRQVLVPPAPLPDARQPFGPRLTLEGYRLEGAVRGLSIGVSGARGAQPYRTAYTLTEGGRAVIGSLGYGGQGAGGRTDDGRFLSRVEGKAVDGRARLRLYDVRGGDPARQVTLPAGTVVDVQPSPDGTHTAALRLVGERPHDGHGRLWLDVIGRKTGQVTSRVLPGTALTEEADPQVRWAGPGRILTATASYDPHSGGAAGGHVLRAWNLTGGPMWTLGGSADLRDAVPSPDGRLFLTVRGGSVPEVRRVTDGRFVRGLGAAVSAWAPLPGGRVLVALEPGAGSGDLAVLDRRGGLRRLSVGSGRSDAVAAAPEGSTLASAAGGRVRLHRGSGAVLATFGVPGFVRALAFSPDGKTLSAQITATPHGYGAGGEDPVRTLAWRVDTLRPVPLPTPPQGSHFLLPVGDTLWREDRRRPAATGPDETRLTALDPSGRVRWQGRWRRDDLTNHPRPDGRAVIQTRGVPTPDERRTADLLRVDARGRTGGRSVRVAPHSRDVYAGIGVLAVAPDGRHVLLGEGAGDGCGASFYGLRLADLGAGREVGLPPALTRGLERNSGCGLPVPFPQAAFAPDGAHLLVRDGNRVAWWSGDFGAGR